MTQDKGSIGREQESRAAADALGASRCVASPAPSPSTPSDGLQPPPLWDVELEVTRDLPLEGTVAPTQTAPGEPRPISDRFPDAPRLGETVGDCLIIEKLGEGGMGVVYKAVRQILKRIVALKVLPKSVQATFPAGAQRFVIEAQSAAALSHPNIVTVYNAGSDGDTAFIEMEYVPGQSVSKILRRGALTESEATRIILATAEAIDYAHERGLMHRDIKPANILLSHDGRVKLSDFGLAGVFWEQAEPSAESEECRSDRLTRMGSVMGTPGFMSPQQGQGLPVDHRTDIYALGATFYALLAGRPPFVERNLAAILARQTCEEAPDIRRENRRVSQRASQVIQRAMARDLDARYSSCKEFIADLADRPADDEAGARVSAADQAFWNSFSQLVRGIRRPGSSSGS